MTEIDWNKVVRKLGAEKPEEGIRRVYLGTVFSLYPSGKFYTPFAHSNVEVCIACAMSGDAPCDDKHPCVPDADWEGDPGEYHCEVCQDAEYREALEREATEHGGWVESGEGDPCDIFFALKEEQ